MKLALVPVGWIQNSPSAEHREENVSRYAVQGLPNNERVTIDATITGQEGKIWNIVRNDRPEEATYTSAQLALVAVETEASKTENLEDARGI